MIRSVALVVLAACGRIGFDPLGGGTGDGGDGDAAPSGEAGSPRLSPCALGGAAPDPLVFQGTVVRVSFAGMMNTEPNVAVAAIDPTGTQLGQDTSKATGAFSVSMPSGGNALEPHVTLTKAGLVTTVYEPDGPIDRSVNDPTTYIVQASALTSIYLVGGVGRDMSMGTLFVEVQDCSGAVIEGATVTMSPAPERMVYTNGGGIPSGSQLSTTAPLGMAIGLNAAPTVITVSAAKAGLSFTAHPARVGNGNSQTMTAMHPAQ